MLWGDKALESNTVETNLCTERSRPKVKVLPVSLAEKLPRNVLG